MIVEIGNILKSFLDTYRIGGTGSNQFIDKLAGVVKTISKTDVDANNRPVIKKFPVACDVNFTDCIATGIYKDLIPDSSLGCILYFEDVSNVFQGRHGRKYKWKAQYRLVCWYNKKKLGYTDCNIDSKLITTFLSVIPDQSGNYGIYQNIEISVLGEEPKSFNPFSKYSYDEDKTQYLMDPFGYFSMPIEVNYELDKACFTEFTKQTEIPC